MALTWITWHCRRCRATVELPVVWLQHQHSKALRCLDCGGRLLPMRQRRPACA
jgi:hypothetical protein